MIIQKNHAVLLSLAFVIVTFTGCETTSTTVVDARTGQPLEGTRVRESHGRVTYTDAGGYAMRTNGTAARVSRDGYRSVDIAP